MKQKKKLSRKVISYVLALVMVFSTMTGIVPGMSLTAYAESKNMTLNDVFVKGDTIQCGDGVYFNSYHGKCKMTGNVSITYIKAPSSNSFQVSVSPQYEIVSSGQKGWSFYLTNYESGTATSELNAFKVIGGNGTSDSPFELQAIKKVKLAQTVTPPTAATDLTYKKDQAQALLTSGASVTTGNTATGSVQYKVGADGTWSTEIPKKTNAGTYNVYYKVLEDDTYAEYAPTDPISVTIAKADPETPEAFSAIYGQQAKDITLPTGWSWANPDIKFESTGGVELKANFAGDDNYNSKNNVSIFGSVAKAAAKISYVFSEVAKEYGSKSFTNEIENTGDATPTYESSNKSVATVDETGLVTIKGIGETTITAYVANDTDNYTYEYRKASYKLIVNPVSTVINTAPTATDITYGQKLSESTLSGGVATVDGSEDTVAGTFAWKEPDLVPNASDGEEYDVVFTPTDTTNYAKSTCKVTIKVNKKAVSATELQDAQKPVARTGDDTVYTGEPIELVKAPTTDLPEDYEIYYSTDDGKSWSKDIPKKADPGTYTVKVKYVSKGGNCNDITLEDITVTITPADKKALTDAITAAKVYYDTIKDNADYKKAVDKLDKAIKAAEEVAKADKVTKADVSATAEAVTKAKATAEAEVKDIDDTKAAQAVIDKINELKPVENIKPEDRTNIEAAREAYEALTDEQKEEYVSEDTLKKLTDAENALAVAEVSDKIGALPEKGKVVITDKEAIEAARAAYEALTDKQKDYVSEDTLKKLTDAETALQIAQVADSVTPKTGADMVYNGEQKPLVNAPTLELPAGYTLQYALGTDAATVPESGFKADIPTATDGGTYYVYMKAVGEGELGESAVFGPIEVTIAAAQKQEPDSTKFTVTRASTSIAKDGVVTGVDDTMEYSTDEGQTWIKVAAGSTVINGLGVGSVQIRYAGNKNYNPSPAVSVKVGFGVGELAVYFAPEAETESDQVLTYNEKLKRYEYVYTGSGITPAIVVEGLDARLTKGLDYTVSYSNNINVDKKGRAAKVTVTGKGNFTNKKTLEFYIVPKALDDGNENAADDIKVAKVVVEKGKSAEPVISYNGKVLKKSDYTVTSSTGSLKFTEPVEGATLTIIAKEGGNFTGKIKDIPVTVLAKADAKKATIKATLAKNVSRIYNGKPVYLNLASPDTETTDKAAELTVTDASGKVLTEGTDFVVSYSENVNVGTVKVTVTGIGDYTGTVRETFKIIADKNEAVIKTYFADGMIPTEDSASAPKFEYRKNGVKPAIVVTAQRGDDVINLVEGTDYKVSYSGNNKVGKKAKFTISFLGNYRGRADIKGQTFEIVKASLKNADITVGDMTYRVYSTDNGKNYANKSEPYVAIDGVGLRKNVDYTVTYLYNGKKIDANKIKLDQNEKSREITVKITGKGNYSEESVEKTYTVKKIEAKSETIDLTKAKIYAKGTKKAIPAQGYIGEPLEPEIDVYVKIGNTWQKVDESFYSVSYVNNIERGKAKIIVNGDGEKAVGSRVGTFSIKKWMFSWLKLIDN